MWLMFCFTAGLVFLIDQATKFFIIKFNIPFYLNKWGPLGSFRKYPWLNNVIWFLHGAVLIIMLISFELNKTNRNLFLGAGLIFGGLSNAVDLKLRGGVVDFIPLLIPSTNHKGPIKANFADVAIIIGDVLFLKGLISTLYTTSYTPCVY